MNYRRFFVINIFLSNALIASASFADTPYMEAWETRKDYMEHERESDKHYREQEREDRKHWEEMEREGRKHSEEMDREYRKHGK